MPKERPPTWQQAERRALVADLARTQATLQARSEQLREIFASRWYRLARFFWRLRRGSGPGRPGEPKMAGEESFARPLDADVAGEAEARLVPRPGGGAEVDLERQRWLAGARMGGLGELRVAAILDEETEVCLAPECDLDTGFGASDWRERLEAHPPHLLLVESAWVGNGGGWRHAIAPAPGESAVEGSRLGELVAWCRERGVPTAFWNTRDPVEFERFAETAVLFEHIFSSDADRIPAYRELAAGSARTVAALPLAAQPRLHNPIAVVDERRREPAFAGVFERGADLGHRRDLELLLDAALPFGLVVYERDSDSGYGKPGPPERFLPCVEGRLSYAEAVDVYKRHRVFLNANPAPDSPTMLPRRMFELLACGTAVLSTPGAAIEEMLEGLVEVARDESEARERLERLLEDADHRRDLTERAARLVLAEHTYRDRLAEVASAAGFTIPAEAGEEVAALLAAGEPDELGPTLDSLAAQSLSPAEVLLGLEAGALAERDLDRLSTGLRGARIRTIAQDPAASRSERLRELARLAASPWVAPLEPGVTYDVNHLRDLVACTRFAEAEVIGFAGAAEDGAGAHRYVEAVAPSAALAARAAVTRRGWPRDEAAMRRWFAQGVRIYAGS